MKISGVLLILVLVLAPAVLSAERDLDIQVVDHKISIRAGAVPLGRLLVALDQATETHSTIPPELTHRIVSVRISGLDFEDAVHNIFEGLSLDYVVIRGKGIVVTRVSQSVLCDIADASSSVSCTTPVEKSNTEDGNNTHRVSQDPFVGFSAADAPVPALAGDHRVTEHTQPNALGLEPNVRGADSSHGEAQGSLNSVPPAGVASFGVESSGLELLRRSEPRLPIEQMQSLLDPGTVLLFYAVSQQETVLSVAQSKADRGEDSGLREIRIPIAYGDLQYTVAAFRELIQTKAKPEMIKEAGRQLFHLIIPREAEDWIEKGNRVLISSTHPPRTPQQAHAVGPFEGH